MFVSIVAGSPNIASAQHRLESTSNGTNSFGCMNSVVYIQWNKSTSIAVFPIENENVLYISSFLCRSQYHNLADTAIKHHLVFTLLLPLHLSQKVL